ncbi:MAG: hypothetical protein ACYCW6_06235 [Candidatus Xenobia bacterium]
MNIPASSPRLTLGTSVASTGSILNASTVGGSPWKPKGSSISAPQPKAPSPPTAPKQPEKDWTVLFYLNGNNELGKVAATTVRQLEYVGTTD